MPDNNDTNSKSAIELIYNQINEFIGGNDPNQIFTMLMPGSNLNQTTYEYDTTGTKPSLVAGAESQLADRMFDVANVSLTSNGEMVSEQYLAALNALVPKLNQDLEKVRNKLRGLLLTNVERTHNGKEFKGSLVSYFHQLFNDWLSVKQKWNQDKLDKLNELKVNSKGDTAAVKEQYNQWYTTVAESRLQEINAAYDAVLTEFSPDEYGVIIGILDSGDGGRLQALRNRIRNMGQEAQSGGKVYPVDYSPTDWASMLSSDFNFLDLLSSPEHIQNQITLQQNNIDNTIQVLEAVIDGAPDADDIKQDMTNFKAAQAEYTESQNKLLDKYTDGAILAVKMYLNKSGGKEPEKGELDAINEEAGSIEKGLTADQKKNKKTLTEDDLKNISDQQKALIAAQSSMMENARNVGQTGLKLAEDQGQSVLGNFKKQLQQLVDSAGKVKELEQQLSMASSVSQGKLDNIFRDSDHGRFTLLDVNFSTKSLSEDSSLSTSFSQTDWSVDLFLASASGSKSESSSDFSKNVMSSEMDIQISMLVSKVDINRGWLDLGIFKQTADYARLSKVPISKGAPSKDDLKDPKKLKEYNQAILPAIPTALIIAKDISIKFSINESEAHAAEQVLTKHMDAGGGFLCFSVSHTEDSHSDKKSSSTFVQGTSASIRIQGPEVLGWVQQFTSPDESEQLDWKGDDVLQAFIKDYRSFLDGSNDMSKKDDKAA